MLSKEMQEQIEIGRQTKTATKNLVFTPELVMMVRANTDQALGSIPVPEEIEVQQAEINGISGEFYRYKGERPVNLNDKIVLFIHGGGFATGSVASRRYMCTTALKYAKLDCFSMEYTQFPEGQFPEGLVDAVRAFKGLIKKGYAPENIYMLGESGGAMLALTSTLYLKDHGQALPGKICVFSPATNIETENDSRKSRDDRDPCIQGHVNQQLDFYVSASDRKSPYISSIYGDYTGFPKLQVHVGTEEVLWDDSVQLVEKAKAAGCDAELKEWEGLFHVFPMFPAPESEEAMKYVADFLVKP